MAELLRGKKVKDSIIKKAGEESRGLIEKGIQPKVAIIRVGSDESDLAYEKSIRTLMKKADVSVERIVLDENISQRDFDIKLGEVNGDRSVNGILIFRPLPSQLDEDRIKYLIRADKDIDCMSPVNFSKIFISESDGFAPCTPLGVMELLDYYDIDLSGKNVVMVGRSLVVGKPLSMMLLDRNATLTICHSRTKDLKEVCRGADILVVAIGRGNMINRDYISKGTVVIDVGINFVDGTMVGDVDFESAKDVAGMITPVPGGVGGVTTACLVMNAVRAARQQSIKRGIIK